MTPERLSEIRSEQDARRELWERAIARHKPCATLAEATDSARAWMVYQDSLSGVVNLIEELLAEVESPWPDWMRQDAQTILAVMNQSGGWIKGEWPHEQDAEEKLRRILQLLTGKAETP